MWDLPGDLALNVIDDLPEMIGWMKREKEAKLNQPRQKQTNSHGSHEEEKEWKIGMQLKWKGKLQKYITEGSI